MDWLFENFRLVAFICVGIYFVIKNIREKTQKLDLPPKRDIVAIPIDDNVRRVREEILKKRAEREKAATRSPVALPADVPNPSPRPSSEEQVERLRALREQLAASRPPAPRSSTQPQAEAKRGLARLDHLSEARRAWVASEIFGKPISLR